MESSHAQADCSGDVFSQVVDVQSFFRQRVHFAQCMVEDSGGWLASSDSAGIDAHEKMADESECRFDVRDVDGVGIRKQGQAAICCEAFKKRVGENRHRIEHAVPTRAEFIETERQLKLFGEMLVPIPRRHPAFLPVVPTRIGLQRVPHLLGGKAVAFAKRFSGSSKIDLDNDSANIENDCSGQFANWTAKNGHGYFRSEGVAETTAEVFAAPANLARSTLMIGGSTERKMTTAMT
jgi:hypothetical protein